MKDYTDQFSITMCHQNRIGIEKLAELQNRSRSKMIDIAVAQYIKTYLKNK